MFNLIVISIQDCIEFSISNAQVSFHLYSLAMFLKDFAPVLDLIFKPSLISTHIHIHNLLFWLLLLLSLSQCFSRFSIQTKKWSKRECKRRSWKLGSFLLLHLVLYAPTTQRWLNWFHECPSFSPEWIWWKEHILLLTRSYSSKRSSCNRFLLTWIHFQ